jgi:hypothetical protein
MIDLGDMDNVFRPTAETEDGRIATVVLSKTIPK